MAFWLLKISMFFLSAFLIAAGVLKFFRRRGGRPDIYDPEIITVAVIGAALVTGLLMSVLRRIVL